MSFILKELRPSLDLERRSSELALSVFARHGPKMSKRSEPIYLPARDCDGGYGLPDRATECSELPIASLSGRSLSGGLILRGLATDRSVTGMHHVHP